MSTFEKRLERLEEISESMKDEEKPLKESLSLFEEGIELAKELEKELEGIEQRVQILVSSPEEDTPVFKTFDKE